MTRTTRAGAASRAGFTLIEMLVVISIIAILVALLGVALSKTTERQKYSSSRQQVDKLQKSLDAEVDRVVKQCQSDRANNQIPSAIVTYCDNNPERALALWTAMQLRRQFPDTFADAVSDVTVGTYTLQHMATFNEVAGLPSGSLPANEESGALLYIILAKKSVSGNSAMTNAADDLSQGMKRTVALNGKSFQTFADAFDNSVGFLRWYDLPPAQVPPHVDTSASAPANKDPLDTRNLLAGWADTSKKGQLQTAKLYTFNNLNRTANVYAPAKDKLPLTGDDLLGIDSRRYGK